MLLEDSSRDDSEYQQYVEYWEYREKLRQEWKVLLTDMEVRTKDDILGS